MKESEIPASILGFATTNYGMENSKKLQQNESWHLWKRKQKDWKFCLISKNNFTYNDAISLYPDENLVTQAFSQVRSGGTWTPVDCIPQVKGKYAYITIGAS